MADAYVGQLIQYIEATGVPHDARIVALYGTDNPSMRVNVDLSYANPPDSPPRLWSQDAAVNPQTSLSNVNHQSTAAVATAYWTEI